MSSPMQAPGRRGADARVDLDSVRQWISPASRVGHLDHRCRDGSSGSAPGRLKLSPDSSSTSSQAPGPPRCSTGQVSSQTIRPIPLRSSIVVTSCSALISWDSPSGPSSSAPQVWPGQAPHRPAAVRPPGPHTLRPVSAPSDMACPCASHPPGRSGSGHITYTARLRTPDQRLEAGNETPNLRS